MGQSVSAGGYHPNLSVWGGEDIVEPIFPENENIVSMKILVRFLVISSLFPHPRQRRRNIASSQ
jgi:hypothetical protein